MRKLRILVHDYSGHPFPVQLSRELAKRGHTILHLYASFLQTPRGSLEKKPTDSKNFHIHGIHLKQPFKKLSFVKRRFQEVEYGRLLAQRLEEFRPHTVISGNTPLDPQSIALGKCKTLGIKFIFWVQDVYSLAIYNILRKKSVLLGALIGHYYMRLERNLLRESDEIVLISEDFLPLMRKWRVQEDKIHVIQNWSPVGEIPIRPKRNRWAKEHGVDDKLCILYSGTLGMKHNPELLLQLAIHFRENKDIIIVVVSEGLGATWLKDKKEEFALDNLMILDFQPYEQLPEVLSSGDILVGILEQEAGAFSVPSKVLSYMCAGRPQVLAVPPENLAARIVTRSKGGLVVYPEQESDFIKAIKQLLDNHELRLALGRNALKYARNTFDIKRICNAFESILL